MSEEQLNIDDPIRSLAKSLDQLISAGGKNSEFNKSTERLSALGAFLVKVTVPYSFAYKGFKRFSDHQEPQLIIRQVRNDDLDISRRVVNIYFGRPKKAKTRASSEIYVIDDYDELYNTSPPTKKSSGFFLKSFIDYTTPIEPSSHVKQCSPGHALLVASKIMEVSEAARMSHVVDGSSLI